MKLFSYTFALPKVAIPPLRPEDSTRFNRLAKMSSILLIAALALRILLPVPGQAVALTAATALLTGVAFIRYTLGDTLQDIQHTYPNLPKIALFSAILLQPSSVPLGSVASLASGFLYGFYFSRSLLSNHHEMLNT